MKHLITHFKIININKQPAILEIQKIYNCIKYILKLSESFADIMSPLFLK